MNNMPLTHINPDAATLIGLGPQARHLLDAAMALDLSQRRLLAAALRPGPRTQHRPALPIGSAAGRVWLSSDSDATAARHAVFDGPHWRRTFRPSVELHVYIVGTPGLQALAVELGLSLAKIGTCRVGQYEERLARLRRDGYGSVVRRGTQYVVEPGFDRWGPPPRLQIKTAPPLGPVRLSAASLIVTLPEGITHGLFEYDLNQALRPIGLTGFADSDRGRAWCTDRGADPRRLIRFTGTSAGEAPEAAAELMLFRQQADGAALATVIEAIVLSYVGLPAPCMAMHPEPCGVVP